MKIPSTAYLQLLEGRKREKVARNNVYRPLSRAITVGRNGPNFSAPGINNSFSVGWNGRYVQYTLAGQLAMRQLCPIIDRGHFIIHKVTQTRSVLTQKVLVTHRGRRGKWRRLWLSLDGNGFREASRPTSFPWTKPGRGEGGGKRAELAARGYTSRRDNESN